MEFTAKQIAEFIQGRVEGDENAIVNTFAKKFPTAEKISTILFHKFWKNCIIEFMKFVIAVTTG